MKISCDINLSGFTKSLSQMTVEVPRTNRIVLEQAAEQIMEISQEQVPRDTETLAHTAFIQSIDNNTIALGYLAAGQANPKSNATVEAYMVKQHEDLSLNHPNGGKAKFLEDPVNAYVEILHDSLSKGIAKAIKRAGK